MLFVVVDCGQMLCSMNIYGCSEYERMGDCKQIKVVQYWDIFMSILYYDDGE